MFNVSIETGRGIRENKEETIKEEIPKEENNIEEYTADLIMVGDALVHNSLYNDANKLANYNGYNFKPHIELIKEEVKIVTDEETLTLINEKIEEDSNEETVSEEDLKKKTKKKNNKE